MRKLICFLLCCIFQTTFASVAGDIGTVFDDLGYDGNLTGTSAYQGQEAGYYSGGSLFLRNGVKNVPLTHLDLPSFNAGCNGIDLYLGGFSFITGDGLVKLGKKILSSAANAGAQYSVAYAVDLALSTITPDIAKVKTKLEKMIQLANNSNINSCQMGQTLAGGLWPKLSATHAQICETLGSQDNIFNDWAMARQQCGTGGKMQEELNKASKEKKYKTKVLINTNLVWDDLHRNAFLSRDDESAELLMSLSGTIIFNAKGEPTFLQNLSDDKTLIKMLLNGGSAEFYQCDEMKKCLSPAMRTFHLSAEKGLRIQTKLFILHLMQKMQSDDGLTDIEKGFLNATVLPVLKLMSVSLTTNNATALNELETAADIISASILKEWLLKELKTVRQAFNQSDIPEEVGDKLTVQIMDAIDSIKDIDNNQSNTYKNTMMLVQSAKNIEKTEAARASNALAPHANLEATPS